MEQNPITPADSLVSIQDLPRQQNDTGSENVSSTDMTPTTIKTSHLSREFKDILNLLDKRSRREGTCMLLKQCIQKQVIPKTFKSANTEFYTDFCSSMKNRCLAVEQVRSKDPFILKARESWTIQKLDCYRNGQNKEP